MVVAPGPAFTTVGATAAALLALPLGVQAASYDCLIEPNQVVEVRSPVEGVIDRAVDLVAEPEGLGHARPFRTRSGDR